jgi:hypothetical protein
MHIPVAPGLVFETLDSDRGRASFWAESAVQIDTCIRFRFANGCQYNSRIVERQPPALFSIEYMGGPVQFELSPDDSGGTDLLLTHRVTAPDDWSEIHAGWLNVLFPLKAWLTYGIDLRNHDPERSWDRGYADQ